MFERGLAAYCIALRTWWLTSRFLTYQSPLRLLALLDIYEKQAQCHNLDRVAIGDMVRFVDVSSSREYRMTLVGSKKSQPLMGLLASDSHLGAHLLGRAKGERFEIDIFHQRRSFMITEIVHQPQSMLSEQACDCVLCQ